jgi:hypothetical protein
MRVYVRDSRPVSLETRNAKLQLRNLKLVFYNLHVSSPADNRRRARVAESIGLAILAIIILVFTLARYGRAVNWSLR